MVFKRINWTLWTVVLDTVGIYNICKIHILNYLKTNTMKKLFLVLLFVPIVSFVLISFTLSKSFIIEYK